MPVTFTYRDPCARPECQGTGGCVCPKVWPPPVPSKPYKCPVCDGSGKVSRPPHIPGDVASWTSNEAVFECNTCTGSGVVWSPET